MSDTRGKLSLSAPGAAFAERHIDADGFRLRYLEGGQGPSLIHLPGAGALRLEPFRDRLAERFRVIAFETPAVGPSAEDERSRTALDFAPRLAEAADALGLDRFGLIGTSLGGALALRLAVEYPDRVEALVLESPPALAPADAAGRDVELEARLASFAVPVLALFGTRDQTISREAARLYPEKLPNCHMVLVYGAGHAIAADRPEAFASLVADFLERRDQFVVSRASSLLHP